MWRIILPATVCIFVAISASETIGNHEFAKNKGTCNITLENKKTEGIKLNVSELSCHWNIETNQPTNFTHTVNLCFTRLFLYEDDEVNVFLNEADASNWTNPLLQQSIKAQKGMVTVVTGLSNVTVAFKGTKKDFIRDFEVQYTRENYCPVPPDASTIHSPIGAKNATKIEHAFNFNEIQNMRAELVFTFKEFNMSSSTVKVEGSTLLSEEYTNNPPEDFFLDPKNSLISITVDTPVNSSDYFVLNTRLVDTACSGVREVSLHPETLISSKEILNNGSYVIECLWLVMHKDPSKILGLKFDTLDFQSVFDIVAVNDGLSEVSPPLLQVTTSNRNTTKSQVIRSGSGAPRFWISFKPESYASHFSANVTFHTQGGYLKNSGSIKMDSAGGNDTVFLLEVNDGEIVKLEFEDSNFQFPASLSIYDGFDTSNLLTTLYGQIKFPVLSKSSRMMVVGTNFELKSNHFSASFKGIAPGCDHMSSLSTENYILSENCNSSCTWVIPPQDTPNSEVIIYLQYISLNEGDQLSIHKLDAALTPLGVISGGTTRVPHLAVPSNVGALVNVTQAACQAKKDKIVLIGHSTLVPDCSHNLSLKPAEKIQISSPLYPDTYPLYTTCQWNISVPKESLVHMAFQNLKLAENHCVRIFENASKVKNEFDGKTMPDDLFLRGDVNVQFDSTKCNSSKVTQTLNADVGFLLNVTIADCGEVYEGKMSGEFNANISGSKSLCMWKINVYKKDSVNIISYSVSKKDSLANYELTVYDGSTVRDSEIVNNTSPDLWSRSSVLIFVYKRLNVSQPSAVLTVKYSAITCNSTMLCDNKVCLHPDWRCNGVDDCGDFSDERNCASVPVPPKPEVEFTGYSATAFWLCVLAMLLLGGILGILAPVCYQKYKDSRYTRFRELSGIDG